MDYDVILLNLFKRVLTEPTGNGGVVFISENRLVLDDAITISDQEKEALNYVWSL
jgi:hypothetical protein